MLETKEQKEIFFGCLVLVVILFAVTVFSKPKFSYVDQAGNGKPGQDVLSSQAYLDYINSLKVDPAASKVLFQEIISEQDIRDQVNSELQTNQAISIPQVDTARFNVTKKTGQSAVTQYLTDSVGPTLTFNKNTESLNKAMFASGSNVPGAVRSQLDVLQSQLAGVAVPQEAIALHSALMASLASYKDLTQLAAAYDTGTSGDTLWPKAYSDYAAINESAKVYNQEFQKLDNKYKLSSLPPIQYAVKNSSNGFSLIPQAHALFGVGDFTITFGDIPRLIMDQIQQGLVSSFSQFMASFLNKLIGQIESNYRIANFLYYSDALVTGQYADDYLNKYVNDPLDRKVIKQFMPQFSCGTQNSSAALQPLFKAKAAEYLGFDPSTLNPNDPNYYSKLAHVGDFLASPQGWQSYYEDVATQAETSSQQAIDRELSSNGLKSPRDSVNSAISASINSIADAEQASFDAVMQLGIANASDFISSFVSSITQDLVNKFVFSGVVQNNGGSIGVLKEQPTCLAAAQLQLVIPVSNTQYNPPPPAPTPNQEIQSLCNSYPSSCPAGFTPKK